MATTKTTRATKTVSDLPAGMRRASVGGYLPAEQSAWIEFKADDAPEDAPKIRVKIRTDVTNEESTELRRNAEEIDVRRRELELDENISAAVKAARRKEFEDLQVANVWDQVAPFVLDWNIQHRAEDGVVYDVLPPAEVGGGAFAYIPGSLFMQINLAIVNRAYRRIDPKSSVSSVTTEDS